MVPTVSRDAYQAARERAALFDRSDRGRIVVSGADRRTYLQGLFTNDIAALTAGRGCYTAYLTPQGRMMADLLVYELGDLILLTTVRAVKDAVLAKLDQFIFGEDVTLGDVTDTFAQIAVIGPRASTMVATAIGAASSDALDALEEHDNVRLAFGGQSLIVARITDTGEPGFDLFVDAAARADLVAALQRAGAEPIDAETANALRIEGGIPLFHHDMNEATIPLEAGIESRAISLTKGCYVGQEVIIRVLHRGHGRVARRLVGLTLEGQLPPSSGAIVRTADREVGHVTSSTLSPALGRPIALAYVHRDFVEPGTELGVEGARAVVTALPFVRGTV